MNPRLVQLVGHVEALARELDGDVRVWLEAVTLEPGIEAVRIVSRTVATCDVRAIGPSVCDEPGVCVAAYALRRAAQYWRAQVRERRAMGFTWPRGQKNRVV